MAGWLAVKKFMSLFVNKGGILKWLIFLFLAFLPDWISVTHSSVAGLEMICSMNESCEWILQHYIWANSFLARLLAITSLLAEMTRTDSPVCVNCWRRIWEQSSLHAPEEVSTCPLLSQGPSSSTANQCSAFQWHELISERINCFFRRCAFQSAQSLFENGRCCCLGLVQIPSENCNYKKKAQ